MKRISVAFLILFCSSILGAEIIIEHNPAIAIDAGKALEVQLNIIDGFSEINSISVLYREQGEITYKELEMDKGSVTQAHFSVKLEDARTYKSAVEYFFRILNTNNQYITQPEFQAEINPYRVAISQPALQKKDSGFVLLSPDPEYSEFASDFMIAISFFAIKNNLDHNSIKLLFNGKDVTAKSKISSNMIVYNVTKASGGMHTYKVSARLKDGSLIESDVWQIKIADYSLKTKMNLTGRAIFRSYYTDQSFDAPDSLSMDNTDKWANLTLQFKGALNWLRFDSKILVSSLETSRAQAVNRYNLSLYTKYLDLIGGDYTPQYGTFVMSSKNIMGIHANLHFTQFRLKTTYGKINRAVEYGNGTYTRNSIGIRTELGDLDNYVWGFSVAKNKDDKKSISQDYYDAETVSPDDNIIVGTDFSVSMFRKRLLWGVEAAMSYLNTNIWDGARSIEELEDSLNTTIDLPIDPLALESIFVINENIEPIIPGLSSLAYRTYLRAFFLNNFLNINYSAVGTSFNSYSSNYLQKDNAVLSLNDNINLFRNKLFLSFNLNLTSDNLYDEKSITTSTKNISTQAFYRYSSNIYLKLGYMTNETTNSDSLLYDYTTDNISTGVGFYVKGISFAPTRFSVVYNNSNSLGKKETYNIASSTVDLTTFETKRDNVNFTMNSNFSDLPLETTIAFTISLDENLSSLADDKSTDYKSFYLKGLFSLQENKLMPYADLLYTTFGGDVDKSSFAMNLGTNYYIFANTFLSTNLGAKFFTDNDVDNHNFNLYTWRLKITQNF